MQDERFEWDDKKAARNYKDHGVTFEYARCVFDDRFAADFEDTRADYGEQRFNIIAMSPAGVLLHVTYTERGDRIRIISARRATKHETRLYTAERTSF